MIDMLEVMLDCAVCGCSSNVEGVESPAVVIGLQESWSEAHKHTLDERKQYHDAQIAVEEYRHSHPYGGEAEDD